MDFAFSDEQDELRSGVRTVLDAECNVDDLREFELADEEARAELLHADGIYSRCELPQADFLNLATRALGNDLF